MSKTSERARSEVHWLLAHCLPTVLLRRAAARGDLQAGLILAGKSGEDVFEQIEGIRAQGPLLATRIGFATADHAVVRQVLTSDDFRTGFPGSDGPIGRLARWSAPRTVHPVEPPSLLVTEPPDHTRYRKLVTRVFTVRAVEKLRARTEEVAGDLLDRLAARGEVDLVSAYCAQLPVIMIAEILGVPERDRARVLEYGEGSAPSLDLGLSRRSYQRTRRALGAFDDWLGEHLASLRRNPGDNLLSELVIAADEGQRLTERELKSTAGLVLAAGFETTVNLLGNGIRLLHDHPEERAKLAAEPSLWPNAVEEVLRLDPPVLLTGRMSSRDTQLAGQHVPGRSMITTILAGANRDPSVFDDPLRFDVSRPNARDHISFSAGRHHCLGAALARMEGEVGLRLFAERFPDVRLVPGARRRSTRVLRGYEVLPAIVA